MCIWVFQNKALSTHFLNLFHITLLLYPPICFHLCIASSQYKMSVFSLKCWTTPLYSIMVSEFLSKCVFLLLMISLTQFVFCIYIFIMLHSLWYDFRLFLSNICAWSNGSTFWLFFGKVKFSLVKWSGPCPEYSIEIIT